MSVAHVKQQLLKYIDLADERMIRAMYAMLQNYLQEEDQIVAFSTQGQPLTKKDMIEALDKAVDDVEQGKGLSSDDIRNDKKNW